MNEITVIDGFVFGAISMFVLASMAFGMKIYVDDKITQAKREIKKELRKELR